MKLYW